MDREERLQQEELVAEFLRERADELRGKQRQGVNRHQATVAARNQLFYEQLQESLEGVFKNKLVVRGQGVGGKPHPSSRTINIILSDLHFHSLLNAAEVVSQYGPEEEARRLGSVVLQASEMKPQYREVTDLNVHLLGDIIQNQLYDARDGAPLAQQCSASIYLLLQAVLYWSTQFNHVHVRCTPGNHGRFTSRHRDRAVNQKWDAIETVIYSAIKTAVAVSGAKNVSIEIPLTPFYTWKSFDSWGWATHGDTVLNPGNPAKLLDVTGIRRQMNSINAGLGLKKQEAYKLFICGHVHFGSVLWPPGQGNFVSNGALIPCDAYGLSIGETNTRTGQMLWESVEGHILGDIRFLEVDESTDKDRALNKIIKPFLGF